MFISREKKFIFLHIPKTGGTSVRKTLDKIDPKATRRECFLHSDANYSKAFVEYSGENWDDYFKFTIVRNPFPRMVSFYNHMIRLRDWHRKTLKTYQEARSKLKNIERRSGLTELQERKAKDLDEVIIYDSRQETKYIYKDFADFIKNPWYHMHRLEVKKLDFIRNYVDWLSDENGIAVDYIMKLENIEEDWGNVLEKIGVSQIDFPHFKRADRGEEPVMTPTKQDNYKPVDWRSFYTPELKEIMYKRFEKDLEYFNYDF